MVEIIGGCSWCYYRLTMGVVAVEIMRCFSGRGVGLVVEVVGCCSGSEQWECSGRMEGF